MVESYNRKRKEKKERDYMPIFFKYYNYCLKHTSLVWFGLVLWHINLCRLYNPKSIYIYIYIYIYIQAVLFQTIQFRISTQFKWQKKFYFKQFSLGLVQYFIYTQLNEKNVLFQTIQFSISLNVKTVLFQTIQFDIRT